MPSSVEPLFKSIPRSASFDIASLENLKISEKKPAITRSSSLPPRSTVGLKDRANPLVRPALRRVNAALRPDSGTCPRFAISENAPLDKQVDYYFSCLSRGGAELVDDRWTKEDLLSMLKKLPPNIAKANLRFFKVLIPYLAKERNPLSGEAMFSFIVEVSLFNRVIHRDVEIEEIFKDLKKILPEFCTLKDVFADAYRFEYDSFWFHDYEKDLTEDDIFFGSLLLNYLKILADLNNRADFVALIEKFTFFKELNFTTKLAIVRKLSDLKPDHYERWYELYEKMTTGVKSAKIKEKILELFLSRVESLEAQITVLGPVLGIEGQNSMETILLREEELFSSFFTRLGDVELLRFVGKDLLLSWILCYPGVLDNILAIKSLVSAEIPAEIFEELENGLDSHLLSVYYQGLKRDDYVNPANMQDYYTRAYEDLKKQLEELLKKTVQSGREYSLDDLRNLFYIFIAMPIAVIRAEGLTDVEMFLKRVKEARQKILFLVEEPEFWPISKYLSCAERMFWGETELCAKIKELLSYESESYFCFVNKEDFRLFVKCALKVEKEFSANQQITFLKGLLKVYIEVSLYWQQNPASNATERNHYLKQALYDFVEAAKVLAPFEAQEVTGSAKEIPNEVLVCFVNPLSWSKEKIAITPITEYLELTNKARCFIAKIWQHPNFLKLQQVFNLKPSSEIFLAVLENLRLKDERALTLLLDDSAKITLPSREQIREQSDILVVKQDEVIRYLLCWHIAQVSQSSPAVEEKLRSLFIAATEFIWHLFRFSNEEMLKRSFGLLVLFCSNRQALRLWEGSKATEIFEEIAASADILVTEENTQIFLTETANFFEDLSGADNLKMFRVLQLIFEHVLPKQIYAANKAVVTEVFKKLVDNLQQYLVRAQIPVEFKDITKLTLLEVLERKISGVVISDRSQPQTLEQFLILFSDCCEKVLETINIPPFKKLYARNLGVFLDFPSLIERLLRDKNYAEDLEATVNLADSFVTELDEREAQKLVAVLILWQEEVELLLENGPDGSMAQKIALGRKELVTTLLRLNALCKAKDFKFFTGLQLFTSLVDKYSGADDFVFYMQYSLEALCFTVARLSQDEILAANNEEEVVVKGLENFVHFAACLGKDFHQDIGEIILNYTREVMKLPLEVNMINNLVSLGVVLYQDMKEVFNLTGDSEESVSLEALAHIEQLYAILFSSVKQIALNFQGKDLNSFCLFMSVYKSESRAALSKRENSLAIALGVFKDICDRLVLLSQADMDGVFVRISGAYNEDVLQKIFKVFVDVEQINVFLKSVVAHLSKFTLAVEAEKKDLFESLLWFYVEFIAKYRLNAKQAAELYANIFGVISQLKEEPDNYAHNLVVFKVFLANCQKLALSDGTREDVFTSLNDYILKIGYFIKIDPIVSSLIDAPNEEKVAFLNSLCSCFENFADLACFVVVLDNILNSSEYSNRYQFYALFPTLLGVEQKLINPYRRQGWLGGHDRSAKIYHLCGKYFLESMNYLPDVNFSLAMASKIFNITFQVTPDNLPKELPITVIITTFNNYLQKIAEDFSADVAISIVHLEGFWQKLNHCLTYPIHSVDYYDFMVLTNSIVNSKIAVDNVTLFWDWFYNTTSELKPLNKIPVSNYFLKLCEHINRHVLSLYSNRDCVLQVGAFIRQQLAELTVNFKEVLQVADIDNMLWQDIFELLELKERGSNYADLESFFAALKEREKDLLSFFKSFKDIQILQRLNTPAKMCLLSNLFKEFSTPLERQRFLNCVVQLLDPRWGLNESWDIHIIIQGFISMHQYLRSCLENYLQAEENLLEQANKDLLIQLKRLRDLHLMPNSGHSLTRQNLERVVFLLIFPIINSVSTGLATAEQLSIPQLQGRLRAIKERRQLVFDTYKEISARYAHQFTSIDMRVACLEIMGYVDLGALTVDLAFLEQAYVSDQVRHPEKNFPKLLKSLKEILIHVPETPVYSLNSSFLEKEEIAKTHQRNFVELYRQTTNLQNLAAVAYQARMIHNRFVYQFIAAGDLNKPPFWQMLHPTMALRRYNFAEESLANYLILGHLFTRLPLTPIEIDVEACSLETCDLLQNKFGEHPPFQSIILFINNVPKVFKFPDVLHCSLALEGFNLFSYEFRGFHNLFRPIGLPNLSRSLPVVIDFQPD